MSVRSSFGGQFVGQMQTEKEGGRAKEPMVWKEQMGNMILHKILFKTN